MSGTRDVPAGQTDFAPTLLALIGIDAAPLPYVGRNLLGGSDAPVVRPYGDWLDAHHLFLAHGAHARCYDVRRRVPTWPPASAARPIDRRAARVRSRVSWSRRICSSACSTECRRDDEYNAALPHACVCLRLCQPDRVARRQSRSRPGSSAEDRPFRRRPSRDGAAVPPGSAARREPRHDAGGAARKRPWRAGGRALLPAAMARGHIRAGGRICDRSVSPDADRRPRR